MPASPLQSVIWFFLSALPPFACWRLLFRLPLGRRRFSREIAIPAAPEAVWRLLDPRGAKGGWRLVDEAQYLTIVSETPLRFSLVRRPKLSPAGRLFDTVEEVCEADETAGRLVRDGAGVRSVIEISAADGGTRVSAHYEKHIAGLLDYERTRLALPRDLDALSDAALGPDSSAIPLFRFSGWRLALLSAIAAAATVALMAAPGFGFVASARGASPQALFDDPVLLALLMELAGAATLVVFLSLLAVTFFHETGHALACAAFGRRGVMVSLVPFRGCVPTSRRDKAMAANGVFETGVVCLAGPGLSALAALAVMPDAALWETIFSETTDWGDDLVLTVFIVTTAIINFWALQPWRGSDASRALDAIFQAGRPRQAADAIVFGTVLIEPESVSLLLFGLALLATDRLTRAPADRAGWRRRAGLIAALVLVLGLHGHVVSLLGAGFLGSGMKATAPQRP